MIDSV